MSILLAICSFQTGLLLLLLLLLLTGFRIVVGGAVVVVDEEEVVAGVVDVVMTICRLDWYSFTCKIGELYKKFWKSTLYIYVPETEPQGPWLNFAHTLYVLLKGACHEIFDFSFFSWISFPRPLSIPLGPLRIFLKISGNIRLPAIDTVD